MSDFLVGNELLPNVYIKGIEILEGHNDDNVSLRAHVCIVDTSSLGVKKLWSDNDRLTTAMSILFVASSEEEIGDLITDGNIDFSERAIRKRANSLQSNIVDFVFPTIINKTFNSKVETSIDDGYKYFNFTFDFKHNLSKSELKIFSAVYLDETKASANGGSIKIIPEMSYYGPVSSETVFQKSNINRTTTVFLNPNGTQYIGPVHMHEGGYMAGSYHKNVPHTKLTTLEVFNYKIKDYRKMKPDSYNRESQIKKDNNYTPFTELYDTVTYSGNISALFGINVRDMLLRKTKFGRTLEGLNPVVLNSIVSNFKINNLTIIRDRIKLAYGTNKIGSPIETYRDSVSKEYIITSYDENKLIKPLTRLSKNKDFYYDMVIEELPILTAGEEPLSGQFYRNNLQDYNIDGSIKEMFLGENNIRFFEFEDFLINDNRVGEYMYEVELSFKDPTIPFVQSLFDNILETFKRVTDYCDMLSSKKNYNYDMDQTRDSFFDNQDFEYQENYSSAPWVQGPLVLAKMYSYMYNMGQADLSTILQNNTSKLNPRFATTKSASSFLEEMDRMIHKMINYFSFSPSQIKENSLKVFPKNTPRSTLVKTSHRFEKIFLPFENRKRYNFIEPNYTSGVPKIQPEEFLNRLSQERSKLFTDGPAIYSSQEPVDPDTLSGLVQTTGFSYGYISPMSVRDKGVRFDLKEPESIDVNKFNKLFDNVQRIPPERPTRRKKTRKSRTRKRKFSNLNLSPKFSILSPIPMNFDDTAEEEITINSEEYLGNDSSFVVYDKDLVFKLEPIPEQSMSAISSQLSIGPPSKMVSKNTFDIDNKQNILNKIKNNSTPEAFSSRVANLPNHMKALFLSKGKSSKINLFKRKDRLVAKDTELLSKVSYFTIVKVEVLVGYETIKETGEMLLNKPIWDMLDPDSLLDMTGYYFCKMVYHVDKELGIGTDDRTNLAFTNKYFFISRGDLYDPSLADGQSDDLDSDLVISEYSNSIDFSMSQATSNIVTQISNFVSGRPQATTISATIPTSATISTTTTTTATPSLASGGTTATTGGSY